VWRQITDLKRFLGKSRDPTLSALKTHYVMRP
jgi:hypothetical protein